MSRAALGEAEILPRSDKLENAPHPSETTVLFGQEASEAAFLEAFGSGRLHHGWLIAGPRGIGKATLAWRIARFLLASPPQDQGGGLFGDAPPAPTSLDVSPDHPVARRMLAGSDPGLYTLRRSWDEKAKRLRAQITVDDVRGLKNFFRLSATEGGRRVVIVDAADDLNVNAANALLKVLEEPPKGAVLLLVTHQPSRLLPTIRSRCRMLRLSPLAPDAMHDALAQAGIAERSPEDAAALAELASGSVGAAVELGAAGGLEVYRELVALLASMPRTDRALAMRLAESAAQRGAESHMALIMSLLDLALSRLARTGASGSPPAIEAAPGERQTFARLAPTPAAGRAWAVLAQEQGARLRHGKAVNLDPSALILDTVFKLQETARGLA